eukprot:Skav214284  [mRNA]  locus=scaffold7438:20461:24713:- [translate_table: standard]
MALAPPEIMSLSQPRRLAHGPGHTTLRGELTAAIEALRYGLRSKCKFYLWTDNQIMYDKVLRFLFHGFRPFSPKKKDHDLWNQLGSLLSIAVRHQWFQHIVKVSSHQDVSLLTSPIAQWAAAGNAAADRLAEAAWQQLPGDLRRVWDAAVEAYQRRRQHLRALMKHCIEVGKSHLGHKDSHHEGTAARWQAVIEAPRLVQSSPSLLPLPVGQPPSSLPIRDCETILWGWLKHFDVSQGGEAYWFSSYPLLVHFHATMKVKGFRYEYSQNSWKVLDVSDESFDFVRASAWLVALLKKYTGIHNLPFIAQSQLPIGNTFRFWRRCVLLKVPSSVVASIHERFQEHGIRHTVSRALQVSMAMEVEGDNISLSDAITATEHLTLRELPANVHVGPLPIGAVTPITLPLKELSESTPSIKHFVDLTYDVEVAAINIDNLKAIVRDKAWQELPEVLVLKDRRANQGEDEHDAGWDFIISNGEGDKENLKQMRWIHRHIQREGSPIHGWNEKLVQRTLDCVANDGCLAKLFDRYDLTIQASRPEVLTILGVLLPHLRGHSLWLLGESGVGKTALAGILSMMFSRYHGGGGQFRSAPAFDFFRGIFFDKAAPAIFDDGEIGNETIKKKKAFSDVGDSETILKKRLGHAAQEVASNQVDSFFILSLLLMADPVKRVLQLRPATEDEKGAPDRKKSKQERKEEKRKEKMEKKKTKQESKARKA